MTPALQPRTVEVFLGERSYPIHLGAGTLAAAGDAIARHTKATHAAVVCVPAVGRRYAATLLRSLRQAGLRTSRIDVPDGDAAKTLRQASRLYERLLASNADRGSVVVALGGGAVGDLAGFAAATYLRGVSFVQVPTTVLAMVDASIGGKVAVNLPQGKNLVGAFHQPRLVWIDVATLKTLPRREVQAGMTEIIKHAAILGPALFDLLEEKLEAVMGLDEELLIEVVRQNCAIKAAVVGEDERESGYRAVLNFGHTLAHAIEMLTEYRTYLHGEAVAIGMAFAARLSHARGLCGASVRDRIIALLERAGLPTEIPADLIGRHLVLAVEADKKVSGGKVKFVCIEDIGRSRFEYLTGEEVLSFAGGVH
jgi:3-dehydroquinate synthase